MTDTERRPLKPSTAWKPAVFAFNSIVGRQDKRASDSFRSFCKFAFTVHLLDLGCHHPLAGPVDAKTGNNKQASGSSYVEFGNTKVACAV